MRNISQDDLALSADIERAYVGHMERGKKNPTVATLDKLASALDCDVADFFYRPAVSHEIIQPLLPGRKKG